VGTVAGKWHPCTGKYIVSYDPDVHRENGEYDGGHLICTRDPEQAALLPIQEAFDLWQSGPHCECHRLREDGEPNRPLTAFTVAMG
jgi:hypothetical protein